MDWVRFKSSGFCSRLH